MDISQVVVLWILDKCVGSNFSVSGIHINKYQIQLIQLLQLFYLRPARAVFPYQRDDGHVYVVVLEIKNVIGYVVFSTAIYISKSTHRWSS